MAKHTDENDRLMAGTLPADAFEGLVPAEGQGPASGSEQQGQGTKQAMGLADYKKLAKDLRTTDGGNDSALPLRVYLGLMKKARTQTVEAPSPKDLANLAMSECPSTGHSEEELKEPGAILLSQFIDSRTGLQLPAPFASSGLFKDATSILACISKSIRDSLANHAKERLKFSEYDRRALMTKANEMDGWGAGQGDKSEGEPLPGHVLTFEKIKPWDHPVDGAELFKELSELLTEYCVLPDRVADATALWAMHTYCYSSWEITPRLVINSPEKRCGKTRLQNMLCALVYHPQKVDNTTPAALYRLIEKHHPTLLIDEADSFLEGRDELRGILNSGYEAGGVVIRAEGEGKERDVQGFDVFAPVCIACIGKIADTLEDRGIPVAMQRKPKDKKLPRLRRMYFMRQMASTRRKILRWVEDNRHLLGASPPAIPDELDDRAADLWEPLLNLADTLGGDCGQVARTAAKILSAGRDADDTSYRTKLLEDIRALFSENPTWDKIFSKSLVTELKALEESPWATWGKGKGLTVNALAKILKQFKIKSKDIRLGTEVRKGYRKKQFEIAWTSYLTDPANTKDGSKETDPPSENEPEADFQKATPLHSGMQAEFASESPDPETLQSGDVAFGGIPQKADSPTGSGAIGDCSASSLQNPEKEGRGGVAPRQSNDSNDSDGTKKPDENQPRQATAGRRRGEL